jgi:hypothetical protein
VIRTLLFLRAWHAELRFWRISFQKRIGKLPEITDENMQNLYLTTMRYWGDFARGYVRYHD